MPDGELQCHDSQRCGSRPHHHHVVVVVVVVVLSTFLILQFSVPPSASASGAAQAGLVEEGPCASERLSGGTTCSKPNFCRNKCISPVTSPQSVGLGGDSADTEGQLDRTILPAMCVVRVVALLITTVAATLHGAIDHAPSAITRKESVIGAAI